MLKLFRRHPLCQTLAAPAIHIVRPLDSTLLALGVTSRQSVTLRRTVVERAVAFAPCAFSLCHTRSRWLGLYKSGMGSSRHGPPRIHQFVSTFIRAFRILWTSSDDRFRTRFTTFRLLAIKLSPPRYNEAPHLHQRLPLDLQ